MSEGFRLSCQSCGADLETVEFVEQHWEGPQWPEGAPVLVGNRYVVACPNCDTNDNGTVSQIDNRRVFSDDLYEMNLDEAADFIEQASMEPRPHGPTVEPQVDTRPYRSYPASQLADILESQWGNKLDEGIVSELLNRAVESEKQ
jgi:hypothetical protein